MSLRDLDIVGAFAAAASRRRQPLLVVGDRALTYGDVLERSARLTGLYRERGWSAGDRIVVASADPGSVVSLHLSLLRNGLTSIVVDPTATEREARALLSIADARGAFVDTGVAGLWRAAGGREVVEIRPPGSATGTLFRKLLRGRTSASELDTFPAILGRLQPAESPASVDAESIAYILFTSGSTSTPKGVCVSHRALFSHLATMRRQFGYGPGARLFNTLPLHHTDGMNHGPLTAFTCGATAFRLQRFTLQQLGVLLDTVYRERITHLIAVPTLLAMIAQMGSEFDDTFDHDDFRFVVCSAAPLAASLWEQFQTRFRRRVANVYGLTETVVGGLFCGPGDDDFRLGTVGRAVDCEARIVDGDGRVLGDGEVGELEMRGDNLFSGYFGDAAATAAAFRDGWFRTGDLASREDGFHRIVGRRKSLIISGGYNVQPEEVTEVLMSMDGVVEAVTLGLADETFGERVVACVSLAETSTADEAALIAYCRQHLTPIKVPTRVYVLPLLPKGASGKIDSTRVRELIETLKQRRGGSGSGDQRTRIFNAAAESFNVSPAEIHPASRPENTPGWDSFAHLQFVVALEDAFAIRLTTRDVLRLASVADAEAIVAEKLA